MKTGYQDKQAGYWEEESGFISFLSRITPEVNRFNDQFGFNLKLLTEPPSAIDGGDDHLLRTAFVVVRNNPLMSERTYCLYAVLEGKYLASYIGVIDGDGITTLRPLGRIEDFSRPEESLYLWLRDLLKASCDKI